MARFISLIIFLLFLFGCAPAHSPKTLPEDKQMAEVYPQISAEDFARYEFSQGTFNSFMDQATQAKLLASRPAVEKGLGRGLTPSEDKELADIFQKVFREVYPEEEWIGALSKIYARIFTPEEIKEIVAFYQSNSGRHLLEMQSTIMQEAEEMVTEIFEKKEEMFVARLEEEFGTAFPSTTKNLDNTLPDISQLNISETIQACKAMQESPERPIGCSFDYYEGQPAMAVNFQNYKTVKLYWDAMLAKVAGPFCQAANEAKRQALVIVSIQPFDMARIFSCETNEWSEWFRYNSTE